MKRAIVNSHVYIHEKQSFVPNTTVLWEDGIIKQVGHSVLISSDVQIIDGGGCYVTPGLIDSFNQVGLKESGIRWEGDDSHEKGADHEGLSVVDGIYPFDYAFEEARSHGVTTVHVAPGPQNVLAGQTAILKTTGKIVDHMVVKSNLGLAVSLGEVPKQFNRAQNQFPFTRMGIMSLLRERFNQVRYPIEPTEDYDDILHKVLNGEAPLFIRAHRMDDIYTALRLKEEFAIEIILAHATESSKMIQEIAQAGIPVLAGPILQSRDRHELRDLCASSCIQLYEAGIAFALITDHPTTAIRNLQIEAALAIRAGLPESAAINAVTLEPAKILRQEANMGSIEGGKMADLVIWNGEPFELTTTVEKTIINGNIAYSKEADMC